MFLKIFCNFELTQYIVSVLHMFSSLPSRSPCIFPFHFCFPNPQSFPNLMLHLLLAGSLAPSPHPHLTESASPHIRAHPGQNHVLSFSSLNKKNGLQSFKFDIAPKKILRAISQFEEYKVNQRAALLSYYYHSPKIAF